MADAISIKAETKEVNILLDRLSAANKTGPLMQRIGAILQNDTKLNFRRQAAPDGTPWKATKRGGQILSDTRRLRNSIQHEFGNDYARVGTNVIYAATHQFGDPKRNIAARPFLGVGKRSADKINTAIDDWLAEIAE